MTRTISRREAVAAVGFSAVAGTLTSETMRGQSLPARGVKDDYKEDFFYREDWLGEPWRKPKPVVLIHGNDESSVEWYAWVPRMAQEYRLIRPDLPGLGHSNIPRGFEYSLANLATFRYARDGQGRRRLGAYHRSENGWNSCNAICGRLS